MLKNKRLKQYIVLCIITIILILNGGSVLAETYSIVYSTDILIEGAILDGGDKISGDGSNWFTLIYYDLNGDLMKTDNSVTEGSGGEITLRYSNYKWKIISVTKTDTDTIREIVFQEYTPVTLENKNVKYGEEIILTPNVYVDPNTITEPDSEISLEWYSILENNDEILVSNSSVLIINTETQFYNGLSYYSPYQIGTSKYYVKVNGVKSNISTVTIHEQNYINYYDDNDNLLSKTSYIENEIANISFENELTKDGYIFLGWAESKNQITPEYTQTDNQITIGTENINLYPVWGKDTLKNNGMRIQLTGLFTRDTELEIIKIDNTEEIYSELLLQTEDGQEILGAYEIKIKNGESLSNTVITFEVDEKYNGQTIKVFHKTSNGEIEKLSGEVINGKLSITVTELSPFMIAADTISDTEIVNIDSPKTSDNILIISLVLLTIGILVFKVTIKNKKK